MLPIIPVLLLALEIVLRATVGFRLFGDTAMRRLGHLSLLFHDGLRARIGDLIAGKQ